MPNRKLPSNEIIIDLYRSGLSCGEIAEIHNVAAVTVTSLLTRIGEPRRSVKEAAMIRSLHGRSRPASYWLGKKQPYEMVEKRISKIRGEKHGIWKDGESRRPYRKLVKKERCITCGNQEKLCVHHKDFDHGNNLINNLEVLCVSCHMRLHKSLYWESIRQGLTPAKSNKRSGWRN